MQALIKIGKYTIYSLLDIPIIEYIIRDLKENDIDCILITDDDNVKALTKHQYKYCKEEEIKDFILDKEIIYIPDNIIFINNDIIKSLIQCHFKDNNDITILSLYNEEGNLPKIIRKDNKIDIINLADNTLSRECYSGVYIINSDILLNSLKEYNLDNICKIFSSYKIGASLTLDSVHLINNLVDISNINKIFRKKINDTFLNKFVYIMDKDNTYISPDSIIEEGTIIEPGCIIYHSKIGKNNQILANCRIINCVIGEENVIESSSLKDSFIGDFNKIGPYAQFRNNTNIGNYNRIGNFVEIKSSMVANHTNAAHLAYIGNCDCGSNVNFGCGSITVNYDGKHKYKTIIKDNAFIGCNSNLIAPVIINEKGFIAAGSTITNDVEEASLAIARARQINKEGYLKEKP